MDNHPFQNFDLQQDARGVLTVVLNVPNRPFNVFDDSVIAELGQLLDRLERDPTVKVVLFRSGKASGFLAGADMRRIQAIQSPEEAHRIVRAGQQLFNRLEQLPIPTVAAIHGPCLGGGLEFALACKYRLARADSNTRLGLPEIELGVIPGWGGTQRLPATIGLAPALDMILQGKKLNARKAFKVGLVDQAPEPQDFERELEKLVATLVAGQRPRARHAGWLAWVRDHTRLGQWAVLRTVRGKIDSRARHYPALTAAVNAVERGLEASRDEGLAAERIGFADLLFTSTCRNLIELFFQRERARRIATWVSPECAAARDVQRVGVIGAGFMGAGIAQLAAFQGLDVVLRDINEPLVKAGLDRVHKLTDDAVAHGAVRPAEAGALLARVRGTTDWQAFTDCDLAIEAVVERMDIKQEVFRELDRRLPAASLIVSNTSALPVTQLAESTGRADHVAGLHFFSPVHRMQLVEVVRTASASEATVATLVEFVRKLGKTPVVVADSPGFLVNRVLFPYLDEAVRLVCEGVPTEEVDRVMRHFGMPVGPLELLDEVGLGVAADVARSLAKHPDDPSPTPARLAEMVARGWLGRKSGNGFYQYHHGRRGRPSRWNGDAPVRASTRAATEGAIDIEQRLVFALINEAAQCLQEGIVTQAWMVDLAMVLGTGFAPFLGGPLRLADEIGLPRVVATLEDLSHRHGSRFTPSEKLRDLNEHHQDFHTSMSGQTSSTSFTAGVRPH